MLEQYSFSPEHFRRYVNFPFKLQYFGYMPKAYHPVLRVPRNALFIGLVMKSYGGKIYWNDETHRERYEVKAPVYSVADKGTVSCIEAERPWDEIYLGYPEECRKKFIEAGLKIDGRCHPLVITERMERLIAELQQLCVFIARPGTMDRLDMVAFEIIMECILPSDVRPFENIENPAVTAIAAYLQRNFNRKIDLSVLLKRHGISHRTFYRIWERNFKASPMQFVLSLRLNLAKELLRSSGKKTFEIADSCGFLNSMDFCRSFKKHFSLTPGEYRAQNRKKGVLPPGRS